MDRPAFDIITAALDRFFETVDHAALDEACRVAASEVFDIDRLLAWLASAPADDAPKDLAVRRLRAAIGLPPLPGAVCRPVSFGADGRIVRR
jgi:hypothetical protein